MSKRVTGGSGYQRLDEGQKPVKKLKVQVGGRKYVTLPAKAPGLGKFARVFKGFLSQKSIAKLKAQDTKQYTLSINGEKVSLNLSKRMLEKKFGKEFVKTARSLHELVTMKQTLKTQKKTLKKEIGIKGFRSAGKIKKLYLANIRGEDFRPKDLKYLHKKKVFIGKDNKGDLVVRGKKNVGFGVMKRMTKAYNLSTQNILVQPQRREYGVKKIGPFSYTTKKGVPSDEAYQFDMLKGIEKHAFLREKGLGNHLVPYKKVQRLGSTEERGYVMAYANGGSVESFMKKATPKQMVSVKKQILQIVQDLQEKNISHNDLKPDNFLIFLDKEGNPTVKLTDLGTVHDESSGSGKHPTGEVGYGAPENLYAKDSGRKGKETDLFSLGVTLLRLGGVKKRHLKFLKYDLKKFEKIRSNPEEREAFIKEFQEQVEKGVKQLEKKYRKNDEVQNLLPLLDTDPSKRSINPFEGFLRI